MTDRLDARARVADLLDQHPRLWRLVRRIRDRVLRIQPHRTAPGLFVPLHRNDTMLRSLGRGQAAIDEYLRSGRETVALVVDRLADAGMGPASDQRWLEIGCGYGRLLRALVDHVDPDQVWGMEIDPVGRAFCAEQFGVHPVASNAEFHAAPQPEVTAAFAISVLTHLDRAGTDAFLECVGRALLPGGVVLFTTHGETSLRHITRYDNGRYLPLRESLTEALLHDGLAFTPYSYDRSARFGMTWIDPDFLRDRIALLLPNLEVVGFEPAGLDDHQDVWCLRRKRRPTT